MQSIRTYAYAHTQIRIRTYAHTHTHICRYAYTRMRKSIRVFRVYFGMLISEQYCSKLSKNYWTSYCEVCKKRKIHKNLKEKNINLSLTELKYARADHGSMKTSQFKK